MKKVVHKNKREWHEKMLSNLWAYRTTVRTPTGSTPYALVFGGEAVFPLEMQFPSLRVAIKEELTDEENAKLRLSELEALDERRLKKTQQRLEIYQARMSRAYFKRVKRRSFKVGDLVLAVTRPMVVTRRSQGKFDPKW